MDQRLNELLHGCDCGVKEQIKLSCVHAQPRDTQNNKS
jgi:hypothetical protein